MVNRFIQFNDEQVEAAELLIYEQLARSLAYRSHLQVVERKLIEWIPEEDSIAMSVFWRHRTIQEKMAGRRSDLYLLTLGYWKQFSLVEWQRFYAAYYQHPSFDLYAQLFMLVEESRLIDFIQKERPGTKEAFLIRTELYKQWHEVRLTVNDQRGALSDVLLNGLYSRIHGGTSYSPQTPSWDEHYTHLGPLIERVYELNSTAQTHSLLQQLIAATQEIPLGALRDAYYAPPYSLINATKITAMHKGMEHTAFTTQEEQKETIEEAFNTWHESTQEESGIHLQMELEHGTNSATVGTQANEGQIDNEIQSIGKGNSSASRTSDYTDSIEQTTNLSLTKNEERSTYGRQNEYAVVYEERVQLRHQNKEEMSRWRSEQEHVVRSLIREIRKRMEAKRLERADQKLAGRLSRKLTPLWTEERPKIFYRKSQPGKPLDAAFGLLIDGSASMADKMKETQKATLLFHDVLRSLQVVHEIVLFSEDAFKTSPTYWPTTMEIVHSFHQLEDASAAIQSLQAKEDNRDGLAIRWMTERLLQRSERHKFLLIFSDGEPSAYNYARNGILDTAEAVHLAEREGIIVLHLFLTNTPITEQQKEVFASMYGNKTAASDSLENFSDQTVRLIRKLLQIVVY